MREFRDRSGALARMNIGSKVLYSAFLGFVLLGFVSSLALYYDSLGLDLTSHAEHYLGNEADTESMEILLAKPVRELLEVSHFHLFTMPVLLLILGHLFLLARGGIWRMWVLLLAILSTAAHVAGPWAIHFGGPGWSWLMAASGLPFVGSYMLMGGWSFVDMWRRPT
jgi:hypothetical protein